MQITITINNPLPAVNAYLDKQIKSERFQAAVERFNTHRPKGLIQHAKDAAYITVGVATTLAAKARAKVAAIDVKESAKTVLITALELL